MVAVINPPASGPNTLDAFKLAAAKTNSTGSTAPSGAATGGEVTTPGSSSGTPGAPNGTSSPAPSLGAANSVVASGLLGVVALVAGLAL